MASISLGDADIWDDSALIKSWDLALDEYKKFHSIHARGEKVEEVLARAENGDYSVVTDGPADSRANAQDLSADRNNVGMGDPQLVNGGEDAAVSAEQPPAPTDRGEASDPASSGSENVQAAAMPRTLLQPGQDPALQNLMMSWYYAGYYTGLYEGRRQGQIENDKQAP